MPLKHPVSWWSSIGRKAELRRKNPMRRSRPDPIPLAVRS